MPRRRDVLTEQQRNRLIADYVAGVAIAILAKRYGVSPAYPGLLARRRGKSSRTGLLTCPHCGKPFR